MSISEPATLATDDLLAGVAIALGWDLLRRNRSDPRRSRRFWGGALVVLGLAALAGGTWHGFVNTLPERPAAILWKTTMGLVGVADLLMLCGSIAAAIPRRWQRPAMAAALAKLVVYAMIASAHDEYRYVVFDSVVSFLAILLIHAIPGSVRNEPGARFILAGLLLSCVAAAVQLLRIAPHPRFNHNDLYHLIQVGAIVTLYRGARALQDRGPGREPAQSARIPV